MKLMTAIAVVLMSLFSSYAHGQSEIFEVCTVEGPCAIRLPDARTGQEYWVIKEDSVDLSTIWDGEYVIVPDSEYDMVANDIPQTSRLVLPAIEPTSGKPMERKGKDSKSKGSSSSSSSSGGTKSGGNGSLISVGNITVGTGSSCTDCHKGSMYEIHKKKFEAQ